MGAPGRDKVSVRTYTTLGKGPVHGRAGLGSGPGGRQPLPLGRPPDRAGAAASLYPTFMIGRNPRKRHRPGRREQPAHESLIGRATLAEVPLVGISFEGAAQ